MEPTNDKRRLLYILVSVTTIVIVAALIWTQQRFWDNYIGNANHDQSVLPFDTEIIDNFATVNDQIDTAKNYLENNLEELQTPPEQTTTTPTSTEISPKVIEALKAELETASTTTSTP